MTENWLNKLAFLDTDRGLMYVWGMEHRSVPQRVLDFYSNLQKGGDPGAPSGTPTLLRLRPSYQPHLWQLPPVRVRIPTLGVSSFHDVTGGVYNSRERIQRTVLTRVY